MPDHNPPTQTMTDTDARQQFADLLDRVQHKQTRVVVERDGIPAAAIVSADDLARLDRYDEARADRFAGLNRISDAFADVPLDELEREVEEAIAETRARARQERNGAKTL